ncbi:InlB B-repeat-containing protein [Parvimonas parva]|uniref:InlB B-repeat-containing protein n=1 Tax=Parvimonas parva TaxID=2769485 RepID=UPI0038B35287
MQNQFFKKRFLSFLLAIIMIVGFLPFKHISNADVKVNEIYLDSAKGDDNSDGTKEKPVKTFAKAIEKAKDGDTLNVISLTETNITVNKKITLKFISDVTMQGTGTGIDLPEGSHLTVSNGKTLTMTGYKTAINVKKGAEINDGNYVFKFPDNGFAFETSGNIVGTSKDKLKMDITNGYFMFHSKDNELRNATINQRYEGDKWQLYEWNGFKAFNSEINLYRLPVYFKGPLYLDNTKFVIDGTGVNYQTGAYFENSWEVGVFHFTNKSIFEVKNFNTNWRGKGITFGYDNKVLVDNGAKIVVKNNKNGGFNANQGIATFNGGYLEGEGHSGSLFGAQYKANTKIVFGADSVVNTPMKSDSDNGLGQSGTNYIVIGGSHKVKYSPNYQGGLAIPVNGEENGNEKLTWFQLKDKSIEKLTPINKNGKTYDYSVKNPSDDGNKYVWTPAAKATFKLNNNDASFSDKTNDDKEFKTIRGYKLDDVVGNVNPGDPTDKNGVKFLGWYYKTDKGEEKAFDWNGKLTTDTEVYAKWERKTAIYHNGAGKDYISSVSKDAKNIEVLSFDDILKEKDDFKVEGKKFVGWTTASDGSGKVYNAKEKINFTEGQSQIDLYAKYTDDEYKVSFSANGGTFSAGSIFKTKTDVFTIEKDANGGDVAVLKKTAKYNDKLFDLLNALNFDHNSLKPDTNATKTGFVISNLEYFSDSAEAGGKAIRFDDHKLFGFLDKKGENPQITADTTYYLSWKDDPAIPNENKISSQETIDSDIWSGSKQTSKDIKIISENKEFSLTGEVNVSSIKDKMKAIEGMFNKEEKDFDKISLTGATSTFTATLTLPKEVEAPKNLQVEAKGLGDCFEVSETKVNGQKITVTFKLKDGMTDYKKLKEAVLSTGDKDNTLSVTVNGLKLKDFDKIKDGQKFTIKGEVKGDFSAVAKDGDTIKKFDFKWTGNQSKEGKDVESKDDSAIQYTIMVSKPVQLTLGGDLLVKKGEEAYNTEHDMVYPVNNGDLLTFDGKLDVSSIKGQIQSLKDDFDKNNNNSSNEITTKNVKSEFVASIEFPEGLEIPKDLKTTLTNNNLFEIKNGDVKIDGNKIIVKMTLKKDYTKFIDLYTDVISVNDKLDLEIPNIKVKDTAKGNLTVKGEVSGTFIGVATKKDLNTKVFNYKWTGKQTPDGKDFTQSKDDNDSINLTVKLPQELTLAGDILIGDDTEHNALHEVKRGDVLEYTGRLDVSSIKNQIKLLKDNYKGNSDTITTKDIKSEFTATLEFPKGLEIPADLKATLTENKLFEVKAGDVKSDGNKIIVKMTLKNANYTKFTDLYNDVISVPDTLDLKVPGIKVNDSVADRSKLTVVGKVHGNFKGKATLQSGKKESYNYFWTAEQTEDGKDFLIKDQKDNKTIQYTVIVKEETRPGENPGKKPDEKPDEKPGENPGKKPDEKPDKKPDENPKDKPSVNKKQKLVKTNISQSSILLVLASGVLVSFVKKKKK